MTVELRILGSGTAIPHPRRGASGYAVVASSMQACLLECGPGSTRRWPAAGLDFERVRVIACTHHHVDHCADLAPVLFGRNVVEPPCASPLALVGPAGHARLIAGLEALYGAGVADRVGARRVIELEDRGRAPIAPFEIEARVVRHSEGALGLRVRCEGRTVAFSGDSGPCDSLIQLCEGADLALLECSYPAGRETGAHLSSRTAAEIAIAAKVERLVLTHFYPECDAADIEAQVRAAGYRGELTLAEDGMALAV